MIWGFSPCLAVAAGLLSCQEFEAEWVLLRRFGEPSFDGVHCDVGSMLQEAFPIDYLHFRESALPHFARISKILGQAARKSALDQLHGLFDGHVFSHGQQHMKVVGHYDEVVQLEMMFGNQGAHDFDEESRIALGLQETASHAGLGRCKEDASGSENRGRAGVAVWFGHGRG